MSVLNLTLLSFTETKPGFFDGHVTDISNSIDYEASNSIDYEPYYFYHYYYVILVTNVFIFIISCFGIVMNGAIIWILGSSAKVYPFTIYILNLAISDVGVLASRVICFFVFMFKKVPVPFASAYFQFFLFMCIVGEILLTLISADRCISAFFSICHQHEEPTHLSVILCVIVWILCFLFTAIHFLYASFEENENTNILVFYPFKAAALVCLPVMTICTLILVIKMCFKRRESQQVVLFTAITTALLFSLLFAFPLNVICIIQTFIPTYVLELGCLSTCLKSSVNPVIYFLVGKKRGDVCIKDMKVILQRVFNEEESEGEEQNLELEIYSNPAVRLS